MTVASMQQKNVALKPQVCYANVASKPQAFYVIKTQNYYLQTGGEV